MSDFVSCSLCGAVFNGMAVPPHACLNALPQPPVSWPVTTTCPRCTALERALAEARKCSASDLAHGNSILLWLGLSGQSAHMGDVATIAAHAIDKLKGELAEARAHTCASCEMWRETEAVMRAELAEARKEVGKWRTDFDYARAEAARFEGLMLAAESEAHDSRAEVERYHTALAQENWARLAAEAEVERAARWFYASGSAAMAAEIDNDDRATNFTAAWSRYQQEQRCLVTGNACGTDTRPADQPCLCANCQKWARREP